MASNGLGTTSNGLAASDSDALPLEPYYDQVLIRPLDERQISGIFLPEGVLMHAALGVVLAVGPGAFDRDGNRIPMDVRAGEHVRYAFPMAAKLPDLKGRELHLLQAACVYGRVSAAALSAVQAPGE